MKLTLKLRRVPYSTCEFCFFNTLLDCDILDGTRFDCQATDEPSMFIIDSILQKDAELLTTTFEVD